MARLNVVGNAPYAVALDSGRHLHPGEVAEIDDSPRHQLLISSRALAVVAPTPPPKTEPAKSTQSQGGTPNAE